VPTLLYAMAGQAGARKQRGLALLVVWWPSRLVATASADRVSTTIWSGGAAAGLYLGTGLILAFLVHTHYPGALGLREWSVVLTWPLIFFMRSKSEARRSNAKIRSRTTTPL